MTEHFQANERFDRTFLLKRIDERKTKTGKSYLALVLGSSDGEWEGRVWDMGLNSLPGLLEGDPVKARGAAQLYQEKVQLIVETISRVEEPVDPRDIYPATQASEEELRERFQALVDGIGDRAIKALVQCVSSDSGFSDGFFRCPAAVTMHHARIGGLAEHSISVCRLCLGIAETAPWLDRDLLTAGALLHDVGKVQEYEVAGDFRFTEEGKLLGHIIQGTSLVEGWIRQIPDLPRRTALDIIHIILSHHGMLEYGSPKTPATAEALVIHYADDLDAKLDMIRTAGEEPGTREAFVRGLGRSFQYRDPSTGSGQEGKEQGAREKGQEEQGAGRRVKGEAEQDAEPLTGRGTGKPGGQEELF